MDFMQQFSDLDDAREFFIIAKERLLDVNDWHNMAPGHTLYFSLTNHSGQKQHRDMRVGDIISITTDEGTEIPVKIDTIQYDFFPDIRSESISILLSSAHGQAKQETIMIKRESTIVSIHCNKGNELPKPEDERPDEHLQHGPELHPVLNIPNNALSELLLNMIAVYEPES